MFKDMRGFASFISVERGVMLFMISVGAAFLTGEAVAWYTAMFLGLVVFLCVAFGMLFGVLYSVPPFRLRKTRYKPIVNFTVGAVPVMIVAAYFGVSSFSVISLVVLLGGIQAVNSL